MCSATVTQLTDHRARRSPKSDARVRKLSVKFRHTMRPLFNAFFTEADDLLFKMAERADNGADSNQYFDHLRVLRLQKFQITTRLLNELDHWLDAGAYPTEQSTTRTLPSDSLCLMDDDALEQALAVDSFNARTAERSGDQWLAFSERMKVVLEAPDLADQEHRFQAASMGQMVLDGLMTIDAPLKSTLLLFRLFDDMAVPKLSEFYAEANAYLKEDDVLPNLKLIHHTATRATSLTSQAIAELSASLAGLPTQGGNATAQAGVMIEPAMLQQMMASMAQFQTQAAPSPANLEELKAWTAGQAAVVSQQAKGSLEAGTVSLVAMLFEFILDDDSLSAHMKHLLARMQIPVIKVALLDKEFFNNAEHAARQLLNKMARAASGWQPDANVEGDALLIAMEDVVTQLNRDFEDDLSLFDELLASFNAELARCDQDQSQKVNALIRAEQSEYTAFIQQDRAQTFMDALLKDQTFPDGVQTLLTVHWQRLMKAILKKHGAGKQWKTTARIARELVWSLQPGVQTTQSARFDSMMPKLLTGITDGLKAVGLKKAQIMDLLDDVHAVHALHKKPLDQDIWGAQAQLDDFEQHSEEAEKVIEAEPSLPVNEPVVALHNVDLTDFIDYVATLSVDRWFDIESKDGSKARGCLTAIIGEGSKYVFTDYQGEKIAERSAIGLAMSLRNDQFIPLDDDPLFDRMINAVVNQIG